MTDNLICGTSQIYVTDLRSKHQNYVASAIPCCCCHDPAAGLCLCPDPAGRLEPGPGRGIHHRRRHRFRRGRRQSLCDVFVVVAAAAAVVGFLSPATESLCVAAGLGEEEVGEGGGEDVSAVVSAAGTALCILSRVCGVRRAARPPANQGSTYIIITSFYFNSFLG